MPRSGLAPLCLGTAALICAALLFPSVARAAQPATVNASDRSVAAGGDIIGTVNLGMTPVEVRTLIDEILARRGAYEGKLVEVSRELGVTVNAVRVFFQILDEKNTPTEQLTLRLVEIAQRHRALLQQAADLQADDPAVGALKRRAEQAIADGRYDDAEALLTDAVAADLAAARRIGQATRKMADAANARHLAAAASKATLGALANTRLNYPAAAVAFAEAAEFVPAEALLERAGYLDRAGTAEKKAGRYPAALPFLTEALAIRETALGPDHPDTATSLNNLAGLYKAQGRLDEAAPLYARALAIREKALGPDHPSTAISLNNLASLYQAQGRLDEAAPLYARALAIREKALGPDHPSTATSLNNLAGLYYAQGRLDEAAPLLARALAICETALGPDHPSTATSLNNLAELYKAQGRLGEAAPLYARALAIKEKALGQSRK